MSFELLETKNFFSFTEDSLCAEFLLTNRYPWQSLPLIHDFVLTLQKQLSREDFYEYAPGVFLAHSVKLYPYVTILPPAIICQDVEVRSGAFIRGNVFVGPGSVVGNSTEMKNSIMIEEVDAPHYNYIGDSILGRGTHLGAGVITSNLRADGKNIYVRTQEGSIATDLRKFGAITAENVEVGCNAVLNPGTVVGKASRIYPLSSVRKSIPSNMIHKQNGSVVPMLMDE